MSSRLVLGFVLDHRLSREKHAILQRIIQALRRGMPEFEIEVIPGSILESELLEKLSSRNYAFLLAPAYLYAVWSKIDGHFGIARSSGPGFAGYICDQTLSSEIEMKGDGMRLVLLDFVNLQPPEALSIVQSLIQDSSRAGLKALLSSEAALVSDIWYSHQTLGSRMDTILGRPEITQSDWAKRLSALRVAFGALWSLVYEEGPGKNDLAHALSSLRTPRGYFQMGASTRSLFFRLIFSWPGSHPKPVLSQFWHDPSRPSAASQLLLRHADFLRVHTITETSDVEVTVGFFASAPAELFPGCIHTFWVEPIARKLVEPVQPPFTQPTESPPGEASAAEKQKHFIQEAAQKIQELKTLLLNKDSLIRELRSGGVGTAPPLPPPDAETLLEAFQQKFFESRFQIRQFELEIVRMETAGAAPGEIETLRLKMRALAEQEKAWIQKITQTLEISRTALGRS